MQLIIQSQSHRKIIFMLEPEEVKLQTAIVWPNEYDSKTLG